MEKRRKKIITFIAIAFGIVAFVFAGCTSIANVVNDNTPQPEPTTPISISEISIDMLRTTNRDNNGVFTRSTGGSDLYILNPNIYHFEIYGARGGNSNGGHGNYVTGWFDARSLDESDLVIRWFVGSRGGTPTAGSSNLPAGSPTQYNGVTGGIAFHNGGGGGGASGILLGTDITNPTALVIAGGGGGGGGDGYANNITGGGGSNNSRGAAGGGVNGNSASGAGIDALSASGGGGGASGPGAYGIAWVDASSMTSYQIAGSAPITQGPIDQVVACGGGGGGAGGGASLGFSGGSGAAAWGYRFEWNNQYVVGSGGGGGSAGTNHNNGLVGILNSPLTAPQWTIPTSNGDGQIIITEYEINPIMITYNNGHINAQNPDPISPLEINFNQSITLPSNTYELSGHRFTGWHISTTNTIRQPGEILHWSELSSLEPITITAQWQGIIYIIYRTGAKG